MRGIKKRSRRGVSTVVTSVMLVAAVSMIGAALVSWSNSSFAIQTLKISNQTTSSINLLKENFVVEDVWFYTKQPGSIQSANVTIRNTGDLAITVSKIYINNTQVWTGSQTIAIGSVATIKDVAVSWRSNDMQSVWIHTARGTDVKQNWKS